MSDSLKQWLVGMVLAALVSYLTTTAKIQAELSGLRATEDAHFGETLRSIEALRADFRDFRNRNGQP